jgi:hypothetical protein
VLPNPERLIAGLRPDGVWLTALPKLFMTADDVAGANAAIAKDAVSWFAGAYPDDLTNLTFGEPNLDLTPLGYSWPDRGPLGAHDQDWSAAMHYAGFALEEGDWQPLGILSSIEPGVRRQVTPDGPALQISFLQPQGEGLVRPESDEI